MRSAARRHESPEAAIGAIRASRRSELLRLAMADLLDREPRAGAVGALRLLVGARLRVTGGDVPDAACDAVVAEILAAPVATGGRPTTTSWMPPLRRSKLPAAGVALGAALLPVVELLLPDPR